MIEPVFAYTAIAALAAHCGDGVCAESEEAMTQDTLAFIIVAVVVVCVWLLIRGWV